MNPPSPSNLSLASSDLARRKAIAASLLGLVEWESETVGICQCPGDVQHTSPTKDRDCLVYLDGAPTIHCVHSSCRDDVAAANFQLRSAIGKAERGAGGGGSRTRVLQQPPKRPAAATPANLERLESQLIDLLLVELAHAEFSLIQRDYAWPLDTVTATSPTTVPTDPKDHWRLLLRGLYAPQDVLWIGDTYDSGDPSRHKVHFAPVEKLLSYSWRDWDGIIPVNLICPSTFTPGSFSRSNANVATRRYLVVESDSLTKPQILAIFRWLQEELQMRLRAIVDTARRSLHGWFEFPSPDLLASLQVVLTALGCDPALFTPSQPCRLPGAMRTMTKFQRLLWLDARPSRAPEAAAATELPGPPNPRCSTGS